MIQGIRREAKKDRFSWTPWFFIAVISILGPIIGSFIGILKKPSFPYIFNMLCFAAGVMLAISFLELIPESMKLSSVDTCIAGIILGAMFMYGLDRLIPHIHPELCTQEQGRNVKRPSIYLIFGIFLHNFPEGMAISIHNIPEGICTSAPFYHATGKSMKSFFVSSSTAIPILAGYMFARYLFQNISLQFVGLIIGATAGLMIYITADELIPYSCAGENHQTIFSLITGIVLVILLGVV